MLIKKSYIVFETEENLAVESLRTNSVVVKRTKYYKKKNTP